MIKLYNSLTNVKEEFVPIEKGKVKMYTCGLTVSGYAHIGHAVPYVFMDSLKKMFEYMGYEVFNVMNITDVGHLTSDEDNGDDKIEKEAAKTNKNPFEIATYYMDYFLALLKKLNVKLPSVVTRATDNIQKMIDFVQVLIDKGYTYTISDGVYFDVSKFPEYGKLSNKHLQDLKAGARVEINEEKRNPEDFALWKFVEPNHLMKWENPFGRVGCPGWHIECSVMSQRFLGEHFDIHTGGIDHRPIHHENEIAQSEAFCGHKHVNYWMHVEFLKVDGKKMGKSLGNAYRFEELAEKGYVPLDFRYMCLNASYRKQLNFTMDSIEMAKQSRAKLYELVLLHKNGTAKLDKYKVKDYENKFAEAISDDLNIPKALGDIWLLLRQEDASADVYNLLLEFDTVLSLDIEKNVNLIQKAQSITIPEKIEQLAEARIVAKKQKNFIEADKIRNEIESSGYIIIDTKDGYEIKLQ